MNLFVRATTPGAPRLCVSGAMRALCVLLALSSLVLAACGGQSLPAPKPPLPQEKTDEDDSKAKTKKGSVQTEKAKNAADAVGGAGQGVQGGGGDVDDVESDLTSVVNYGLDMQGNPDGDFNDFYACGAVVGDGAMSKPTINQNVWSLPKAKAKLKIRFKIGQLSSCATKYRFAVVGSDGAEVVRRESVTVAGSEKDEDVEVDAGASLKVYVKPIGRCSVLPPATEWDYNSSEGKTFKVETDACRNSGT